MNRNKLIKLLNLTASSHDGEVISAINMANKLLFEEEKTWESVIIKPTVKKQEVNDDQAIHYMNIKKEQANSKGLELEILALKRFRNFLSVVTIILIIVVILK